MKNSESPRKIFKKSQVERIPKFLFLIFKF